MNYPPKIQWLPVLLLSWVFVFQSTAQETASKTSEKEYESGIAARDQGDHKQAILLFKKALSSLDTSTTDSFKKRHEIYNEIGDAKQKLLELDSSSFYYRHAISSLKKAENTPENQFYLNGLLKNRIGLNEFNTGKMQASIKSMKEAVVLFHDYTDAVTDEEEKLKGLKRKYASVDNLGGFYRGLGENEHGLSLAEYSYQQKLSFLEEDDPNIAISRLILGHINLIARNYEAAGDYVDKGLEHIDKIPYLETYALMVRASIYENVEDFEEAERTYKECETIYREGANGSYSLVFLDALVEMSRFYAKTGNPEKAIALAEEGYLFTQSDDFNNDLIAFYHIQNLGQVHFALKNYEEANKYSNEAVLFSNQRLAAQSKLDSIRNEIRKPSTLFLKSKSAYFLDESKDELVLKSLLKETQLALSILERQKTNIKTEEDLATLLTDNKDLIDFTKQLNWDLYTITQDESYLDDLISLHESAIYTRIRSRLNLKNVEFANVPQNVLDRESQLKEAMSGALTNSENIETFFEAQSQWNAFLDSLKTNYPTYHNMRYATIQEPVGGIQGRLDEQVTIVRYLFIEKDMYALVLNQTTKSLIPIENTDELAGFIHTINDASSSFESVADASFQLYEILWKPISQLVSTEKIVIIPDGLLFNLSFDALTPSKINSYTELGSNSLLAQHTISYNYSLFLTENNNGTNASITSNFISFAPEFTSEMKQKYRATVSDSLDVDHAYLSLLPQPFSMETVKEFASKFNGASYLNDASTKDAFTKYAQNHKIIHIATHAESNNLNPELSRLIFAKDILDSLSLTNNYLHTYEIYNHNLSSLLTTLTACETGKPSFQPGEGMISLAHAFNYAGSESILTSLWKIDEQSSTEIIALFYDHLSNEMDTDEALRKAKLDYLSQAQGRTQAPFYWSGLVLMGDTQPIPLSSGLSLWVWTAIAAIGIVLLLILVKRRKNSS